MYGLPLTPSFRETGWKELFFSKWYTLGSKVPTPRSTFHRQLAEPFDLGYRMSNIVSRWEEAISTKKTDPCRMSFQLFQTTVALIMVPIAPLCAIVAAIMLFWVNSSYKFQV